MEIKSLFEDIKSYFPGDSFYIIVPLALVLLIALIVFIIIKRRRKRRKEMKTAAMIDRMSLHRAAINTAYLEKDFSILLSSWYTVITHNNHSSYLTRVNSRTIHGMVQ